MRLLSMFAQIDTVMTYYDKITPHVRVFITSHTEGDGRLCFLRRR